MAGLATLTAGIAHEINNPNNFIQVAAQVLKKDLQEFQEFLLSLVESTEESILAETLALRFNALIAHTDTILNGTERINDIVKGLRGYTRLDEASIKTVSISDCMQSTVDLARPIWSRAVDIQVACAEDVDIECSPALLNQALMNILVNACQAVTDKVESSSVERGRVTITATREGQALHIVCSDNGIGIPESTQAHVFDPFFTTRPVGGGVGLGLSAAHSIVVGHGGTLSLSSRVGVGSTFLIVLPLGQQNHS